MPFNSDNQPCLANTIPTITMKLDGKNYYLWKSIMFPLLSSYNLLGYVDGLFPAPSLIMTEKQGNDTITIIDPEYQQWKNYDQFYLTMISVTSDIGLQLVGLNLSVVAWNKL